MTSRPREEIRRWAAWVLKRGDAVVLDTETTGLAYSDRAVQIGITDMEGRELLNSLIHCPRPSHPKALAVHGITLEQTREAPPLEVLGETIQQVFLGVRFVVSYNAAFDSRVWLQTYLHGQWLQCMPVAHWLCAMEAASYGVSARGWLSLDKALLIYAGREVLKGEAHDAVADCRRTVALLRGMAS